MKIAYFTDMFLPHLNGVTTALLNQITGLSESGHEIYVFAPKAKPYRPIKLNLKNVHVELMPSFPVLVYPDIRFAYPIFNHAFSVVKKFDPDIIHFQSPSSAGIAGMIAAKQLKKPLIGTFHGYFMEPEYLKVIGFQDTVQKITTAILWKYTAVYFNQCDGVVTPSALSMKDMVENGITKDIHVVHNSLDKKKVERLSDEKIQQLKKKIGLRKNVVSYVGRISAEKDIDQLIRSFKLVLAKVPDTHLCIIGKGPETDKLKELSAELGIAKDVIFLGELGQKPLLAGGYYQMSDVFATASTSELQPVSVIEAFALGLPVVGSEKRGTEEMIQGVGLLSKPNDIKGFAKNLVSVLTDPKKKAELQKNSLHAFKTKYDLEATTKQYEKFYKSFLD